MLLYLIFTACTPMDKPGVPFEPVQMAPQVTEESKSSPAEKIEEVVEPEVVEEEFRSKEEVLVSSEESDTAEDVVGAEPVVEPEEEAVEVSEEVEADTTPTLPPQQEEAAVQEPKDWGWPIRVVKTDMGLVPPRAILGLPDGREIVVQSGHMLPEHNLVVMSIGSKVVGFAKIHPLGDHAKVETIELLSQN